MNNNRIAEDNGKIDDYNRSVLITSVFRENKQSSEKAENILPIDETIKEINDSETGTEAEIIKSESIENSNNIIENPILEEKSEPVKNKEASERNLESDKSAES